MAEKTEYALSKGLKVILCVGESLEQRESNQTFDVISKQVKPVAGKVKDWSKIVVAYEPVWAIGTGKVATKEQASHLNFLVAIPGLLLAAEAPVVTQSWRRRFFSSFSLPHMLS